MFDCCKALSEEPYKTLTVTVALSFGTCFAALVIAHYWLCWDVTGAYDKIRPNLFTGFLTVGGFLLSLKTLILVQLRKDVFDDPHYIEQIKQMQALDKSVLRYAPLKNLGEFMLWAVLGAIITAGVHLSFAFCEAGQLHALLSILALSISFTTLSLVVRAWMSIRKSLRVWFETLRE